MRPTSRLAAQQEIKQSTTHVESGYEVREPQELFYLDPCAEDSKASMLTDVHEVVLYMVCMRRQKERLGPTSLMSGASRQRYQQETAG